MADRIRRWTGAAQVAGGRWRPNKESEIGIDSYS
jgi:hypothetical protein